MRVKGQVGNQVLGNGILALVGFKILLQSRLARESSQARNLGFPNQEDLKLQSAIN